MVESKKKAGTRKAATKKPASKKAATTKTTAAATKRPAAKAKAKSATGTTRRKAGSNAKPRSAQPKRQPLEEQLGSFMEGISDFTSGAMKLAFKPRKSATKIKKKAAVLKPKKPKMPRIPKIPVKKFSPEQLRKMADAGESLRDLREVTGLTLSEISKALKLKDKGFMQAIEDGKEALSLEMIMRLASLYARNDPIPFVLKYIRTYRPELWEIMEKWGLDGLSNRIERERRFINIYKRRDAARQLSSEGFEKILEFTQQAFEMTLHFIAEQEKIDNEPDKNFDDAAKETTSVDNGQ